MMLSDLPPELIIHILSLLGSSNQRYYTAKDRQGDLSAAALVCTRFLHPARHLLYTGAVTVRNAGRASLLARTLKANSALAEMVRTFVQGSYLANHAPSNLTILTCTRLINLTLCGEVLGASIDFPSPLHEALGKLSSTLRSFAYYAAHNHHFIHAISTFLAWCWLGLEELILDVPLMIGMPWSDVGRHASPEYSLRALTIRDTRLSQEALEWITGDSKDSLKELTIGSIPDAAAPLDQSGNAPYFPMPPILPYLTNITTLRLFLRVVDVNWLALVLSRATSVRHFGLGCTSLVHDNSSLSPSPTFVLPTTLRSLQLHRRGLAEHINLVEALAEKSLRPSLKAVTLIGQYKTDQIVRDLVQVCAADRIRVEARPF